MTKLLLVLFFLLSTFAFPAPKAKSRRTVALVLSGGGPKGFAHIGVLKVLEEAGIPIDFIVGSSMGSIIGALVAIGYSANDIEKLVLGVDWDELLNDNVPRQRVTMEEKLFDERYVISLPFRKGKVELPSGLMAGQEITKLLCRVTMPVHNVSNFKELPIPFVCLATDVATRKPVILDTGFLPVALRASMAIPIIFTPVRNGDSLLVDGSVSYNFPAEVAHYLGADIIIGIDVGSPLKHADKLISALEIIYQLGKSGAVCCQRNRELCDLLVLPVVDEFTFSDFNQAAEIIARGERAARKALQKCAKRMDFLLTVAPRNRHYRKMPARQDTLNIASLHLEGVSADQRDFVTAALNLNIPGKITMEELENAIDRVYSSQLFERIAYQLEEAGNGMALTLQAAGKPANAFRLGIRYESDRGPSLLLSKIRGNVTGPGSSLLFELRVGQPAKFDAKYFTPLGFSRNLGFKLHANYTGTLIQMYDNGRRSASYRAHSYSLEVFLGTILSRSMAWGIGLKNEIVHLDPDVAPQVSVAESKAYAAPFGLLQIDTIDRTVFPRQGHSILLKSESVSGIGKDLRFSKRYWRHSFGGRAYFQIWERLSLLSHAQLGLTNSSGVFLSHQFFLGGADSFPGLNPHELSGTQLLALQLGLQYEVMRSKFMILRGNVGKTSNSWQDLMKKPIFVNGIGVTLGAATRFGPVELTAMHSDRHVLQVHLNLGYKF